MVAQSATLAGVLSAVRARLGLALQTIPAIAVLLDALRPGG